MAAIAASEGVKNVLGTVAFGLWAAGASLGGSLPKKPSLLSMPMYQKL